MNLSGLAVVYRVRFRVGFALQVLQLGLSLGSLKWGYLDVAEEFFPDYLEKPPRLLCVGRTGAQCLAVFVWLRLMLFGFVVPLYCLFKAELCSRRNFLLAWRPDGPQGALECHMGELWWLVLTYVVGFGTLIGQGYPVTLIVKQLI
jgi:hypothetical protein